jgi:putative heme iron utilization protein
MAATQEPAERDLYAEARLLIRNTRTASLATSEAGIPHAALVTTAPLPPADVPAVRTVLLLSELAIHTRHLNANPVCALLLIGEAQGANPQTTPRLCLTGTAAKTNHSIARTIFLESHPYAALYVDFADFAFWEVFVTNAYYVGGFGAARQLNVAKLSTPQ